MKITRVEVFLLHRRFVYVKVSTDEGIAGWGEGAFHGASVTAEAARVIGERILGRDPFRIAEIWQDCFRQGYRIGTTGAHMAALAAVDIALHDLKGRALATPVWNLLGGKLRDRIPVYASFMRRGLSASEEIDRVEARLDAGFRAVKLHTGTHWGLDSGEDNTVGLVSAVRARFGTDRLRLLVDVNQSYTVHHAIQVGRELERLDVHHFEEPIAPWDLDGYDRLQAALDIPIAAGEQEYNLWQFRDLLERARIDILQPNVTSCGGFTNATKVAALAELHNRPITVHNTSPGLMTVAHLHFCAVTPMCLYEQEYWGEDRHPLLVLADWPRPVDGEVAVPDGPGLGVEVDEDAVRSASAL